MGKRVLLFVFILITYAAGAQQLAFPGAEGFGKYATGGRTGSVYHVTNLNDSGTGSLRDAISQSNRIVVFDVAGVIKISDRLVFKSNQYIAGQTAPGEGITVYGNGVSFSGANNFICRYMKFRMGIVGTSGKDAAGVANGDNMIFDHVSVSWGRDETFSISGDDPSNITIQNSIISQGLQVHCAGGLVQTGGGVTLYRNLYIDNDTRNNKVKGKNQYVNNIVYNWSSGAYIMGGDSEGDSYTNVVGNYFIKGPCGGNTPIGGGNSNFHIYALDNWFDNSTDGTLNGYEIPRSEYSGGPDFQTVAYDYPTLPTLSASGNLFDTIVAYVGASLPYRDPVDCYVLDELKSLGTKGEFISDERLLSIGAPDTWTLWAGDKRTDSDSDGMPDEWENANGTNASANDAMSIAANGYANIENYINSIDASWSQEYIRKPLNFGVQSATQNSITFEWLDYTDKETKYILQRFVNGVFVDIADIEEDATSYTLTGLEPAEKDTFRIYAVNSIATSEFSDELIAKSKPVEIETLDPATYIPDYTWNGSASSAWNTTDVNWNANGTNSSFTANSSVLFNDIAASDQNINIASDMAVTNMLVSANNNYTFSGDGSISGNGQLAKRGSGVLTLNTTNTYTGPTVICEGEIKANKIANNGSACSIGSSDNYGIIFKGGKFDYTGASVSFDRGISLEDDGNFSVSSASTTVSYTGTITGTGGFNKSGDGTLAITNGAGNTYEGETTISGGILKINMNGSTEISNVIGTSNTLNLAGGTLVTTGQDNNYETYSFNINIPANTTGGFTPHRNCYFVSKITGSGTFNFTASYVREYIQGDWSLFSGILVANGVGTSSDGSQLLMDNGKGFPNTRVNLSGNIRMVCWKNASNMYIGGLSGAAGAYLSGADKKNNSSTMKWIVGGASTDETFNGIIDNQCSSSGYKGSTSIEKEGSGIWRLNGNNIYAGTTTITDGTLIVNGTNSGTGAVTVNGGTLAGKGRLAAAVTVNAEASIAPGDEGIGTLTTGKLTLNIGSYANFDINKTSNSYDKISSTGAISYNGTLKLNITGTLEKGNSFTLFSGTSHTGTFSDFDPAIPGEGLIWDFTDGVLSVVDGNQTASVPEASINPSPANNENLDIFADITLSWENSTNKLAGTVYYNVFIGTDANNMTKVASLLTSKYFTTSLEPGTTYYWEVVATNSLGSTESATWSFTTKSMGTSNAILYYPFDETSGSVATDKIIGATATATNFTPQWAAGKIGNAITFSGSPTNSNLIMAHNSAVYLNNQSFTISLWFKSSALTSSSDAYLLHKGTHSASDGTGKWIGIQYKNSNMTFALDDNSTKTNLDVSASSYIDGNWHQLVCVRNIESDLLEMYIDGVLKGTKTDGSGAIGETDAWVIGNRNIYFDNPYIGSLDELEVFASALTADDIAYRFANPTTGINKSVSNNSTMKVYPNPFTDKINIDIYGEEAGEKTIRIVNIQGLTVATVTTDAKQISIQGLDGLSRGVYYCIVPTNNGNNVKKIVKR